MDFGLIFFAEGPAGPAGDPRRQKKSAAEAALENESAVRAQQKPNFSATLLISSMSFWAFSVRSLLATMRK